MCDRRDIGSSVDTGSDGVAFEPTIFIYDNFPGGIGLSRPLYELRDRIIAASEQAIRSCSCEDGCPSCVGPSIGAKTVALALLQLLTHV
jgi:DEAD/DEAH box helicase domain-containing protein